MHLRQLLFSSASLMASQILTAGVGFLFWVVAARRFDEASVGVASAAISAMSLIGAIGTVGMGTLLIREMPLNRGSEHRMLSAALLLSSGLGAVLGVAFVLLAPLLSDEFAPLVADPWIWLSVVVGSGLTAAGLNMDQALVGLLRSELQLVRNIVAAGGRLLLLLATVFIGSAAGSLAMLGSWSGALALSMAALALSNGLLTPHAHRHTVAAVRVMDEKFTVLRPYFSVPSSSPARVVSSAAMPPCRPAPTSFSIWRATNSASSYSL